jgi:hypothetical protein
MISKSIYVHILLCRFTDGMPRLQVGPGPSRLGLLQSPPSTHSIPDWPAPLLLRRPGPEPMAAVPDRCGRVARSGLSGPAVCRLSRPSPIPGRTTVGSLRRRLQGRRASMSIDMYLRRQPTGPKVQRLIWRVVRPTVRRVARPVFQRCTSPACRRRGAATSSIACDSE